MALKCTPRYIHNMLKRVYSQVSSPPCNSTNVRTHSGEAYANVSMYSNIVPYVGSVKLNDETFFHKHHTHTIFRQYACVDVQLIDNSD